MVKYAFARAGNKVYKLLTLTNRVGTSVLPEVNIIDAAFVERCAVGGKVK